MNPSDHAPSAAAASEDVAAACRVALDGLRLASRGLRFGLSTHAPGPWAYWLGAVVDITAELVAHAEELEVPLRPDPWAAASRLTNGGRVSIVLGGVDVTDMVKGFMTADDEESTT